MTKEEITKEIGKKILRPIAYIQAIFLLTFISSPFIWIWNSWSLAWKIGLTGFIATLLFYWIYNITKTAISEAIEKELKKPIDTEKKSKFQQRLEEIQKQKWQ